MCVFALHRYAWVQTLLAKLNENGKFYKSGVIAKSKGHMLEATLFDHLTDFIGTNPDLHSLSTSKPAIVSTDERKFSGPLPRLNSLS